MVWTYEQCEAAARELLRKTRDYTWALRILRTAEAKSERYAHRREKWLKLLASGRRPYFDFHTADSLRLMGDFRDRYARHAALHPEEENLLASWIVEGLGKKPGAYIDVGANMGIVAARVARACPDRKVYALEPDPHTAKRAAAAFALNGLRNATLIQAACSDAPGEVTFYSARGKSESASVVPQTGKRVVAHKVEAVTIDTLPIEGPVSVIKFDVEGHEPAAIRGALETIRRDRPMVIYEYHWGIAPDLGWTAEDVAAMFPDGYEFEVRHGADTHPLPATREMGTVLNVIARPA